MTFAPRFARSTAIAAPMPLEDPVTMATFPARVSGVDVDVDMLISSSMGGSVLSFI